MGNVKGPFFVKSNEGKFELSECCKDCAFGDESGCLMCPCIYFPNIEEEDTEQ